MYSKKMQLIAFVLFTCKCDFSFGKMIFLHCRKGSYRGMRMKREDEHTTVGIFSWCFLIKKLFIIVFW